VLVSALTGTGLDELWAEIRRHREVMRRTGRFDRRRRHQQVRWFRRLLDERLERLLAESPPVSALLPALERRVEAGTTTPTRAVARLVDTFLAWLAEHARGDTTTAPDG